MANRFDIHVQLLPEADQKDTFKFMSFGYTKTLGIKGFQYLINTWLRILLTPKGSDPRDLASGTTFTNLIGSGLTMADARDVAVLAIDQCNEQVTAFQKDDTALTATERLASVQIIDFFEKPDAPGFDIYVEIKNEANERLVLNLPDFADIE